MSALKAGQVLIEPGLIEEALTDSKTDALEVKNKCKDADFLLLQSIDQKLYQFPHLTFQEYFAGRWLARQFLEERGATAARATARDTRCSIVPYRGSADPCPIHLGPLTPGYKRPRQLGPQGSSQGHRHPSAYRGAFLNTFAQCLQGTRQLGPQGSSQGHR